MSTREYGDRYTGYRYCGSRKTGDYYNYEKFLILKKERFENL